jgi:hypothetical protein
MDSKTVRIVDIGRGPQIEGHRLTVMDVFYYLHRATTSISSTGPCRALRVSNSTPSFFT